MIFVIIGIILIVMLTANRFLDGKKFIKEVEPYFKFLMEEDYEFLLGVKYGEDIKLEKRFNERVRNALIVFGFLIIIFLSRLNFLFILVAVIVSFLIFKIPYN